MALKTMIIWLFLTLILSTNLTKAQDIPFSIIWKNGIKLESKDKAFKLKFGGRIMVDHAYFSQNKSLDRAYGELTSSNGTEFRRARFFSSGILYENINYKLQLDFTGGKVSMKDAYIKIKKIPLIGSFTVGHFKEPLRFDALTSSKHISFMERALLIDFSQERNNGFMINNDFMNKKISFQSGFFRAADKFGNDKDANNGYAFTSRITGMIIKTHNQTLHVGLSYSYRKPNLGLYEIESSPEAHLSEWKYIKTGDIVEVQNVNLTNIELVFIHHSLSLQSEFLLNRTYTLTQGLQFVSYYSQLSYFLTGEKKKIKNSYSAFDRIKPKHNYGKGGIGAIEFAVRYSHSDLDYKSVNGGIQSDFTIGLNWYLNPATRFMLNYIYADIKDKGKANILQTRFQIDF